MTDEGTLRKRLPDIPWDQPVRVQTVGIVSERWVCRQCIALYGISVTQTWAFESRAQAMRHIEAVHHD